VYAEAPEEESERARDVLKTQIVTAVGMPNVLLEVDIELF
jgi:hypothetical protein